MANITLEQLKSCKNMSEAVIEFFQKEIGEEAELTAELCERMDDICLPRLWIAECLLDKVHYNLFLEAYNEANAIYCDATMLEFDYFCDVMRKLGNQYFEEKEKSGKIFQLYKTQEYIEARATLDKASAIHRPAFNAVVYPEIVRLYNEQARAK